MDATKTFTDIISQVQSSNLNFRLELSPFSAVIHIKKSVIKGRSQFPLSSPPCAADTSQNESENNILMQRIIQLENEIKTLSLSSKTSQLELGSLSPNLCSVVKPDSASQLQMTSPLTDEIKNTTSSPISLQPSLLTN